MIDLNGGPNYERIRPVNAVQIKEENFYSPERLHGWRENRVAGVYYDSNNMTATIPDGMVRMWAETVAQVGDWIIWNSKDMWICHGHEFDRYYKPC